MRINNLLWGVVLIVVGVVFGLNSLNITNINVFYNCLIKEACLGSVDCYFTYNMRFDTLIREDDIILIGE